MHAEEKDVSDGELAAMQVLWGMGRASIRQLTDRLYPGGGQSQYATVQKQLERLEDKGFVSRDSTLFVHVFSPTVTRDELIGRRVRAMVNKLCGGSLVPLLSHLAQTNELSEAERKGLRELVARRKKASADKKPPRKGKESP